MNMNMNLIQSNMNANHHNISTNYPVGENPMVDSPRTILKNKNLRVKFAENVSQKIGQPNFENLKSNNNDQNLVTSQSIDNGPDYSLATRAYFERYNIIE